MEAEASTDEANFGIKIQQSAKGFSYFEVKVKGDTKEELDTRLNEAVYLAKKQVDLLNGLSVIKDDKES